MYSIIRSRAVGREDIICLMRILLDNMRVCSLELLVVDDGVGAKSECVQLTH